MANLARLVKSNRFFPPYSQAAENSLSPVKPVIFNKMLLPPVTFKLWVAMLLLRKPDAEISNELPTRGYIEGAANFVWIKNGNPPDANALGPRRKPKSVNRSDHRIIERLRHGLAAKAKACFRLMVTKNGKVNRRVLQSCEFEAGV